MSSELEHLWLPYSQMQTALSPYKVSHTNNSLIYLENGKSLIDCVSSWWTACHGYNNPHIIKSVKKQLEKMPHIMFGGLIHEQAISLAKRISDLMPNNLSKVFFSDSGSVSVEVSLKIALQFWRNKGQNNKNKFVYFKNGYHGDTSGAMSVCDPDEGMHHIFKDYLYKNIMSEIPACLDTKNNFKNLIYKYKNDIAAVIIEPLIQGAGGMKTHNPSVINFIDEICKENNILFILDEIATGFGRTGTMFALEQTNSKPDIVCIGKALTGGTVSLAATVASQEIFNQFLNTEDSFSLMHGPTYMANPLACSAANASLDIFKNENRLEQVKNIELFLNENLHANIDIKEVKDVRVKGAMGVIEFESLSLEDINWFKINFINEGLWLRPFNNIIYIMPPFIVSKKQLFKIVNTIEKLLKIWSFKNSNK